MFSLCLSKPYFSRFSPYEWQIEESIAGTTVSNHFSVINSLWFALGMLICSRCIFDLLQLN